MSAQDRGRLWLILGVGGGVAILFFFYVGLVEPYFRYDSEIAGLENEIDDKRLLIDQKTRERRQMERWRMLSLAGAPNEAVIQYTAFLEPLLAKSGLSEINLQKVNLDAGRNVSAAKKPPHTILTFNVDAKGELASLVKLLDKLEKGPYVHRVKNIDLSREGKESSRLTIHLTIEVVIVNRSERQSNTLGRVAAIETLTALQRAPIGLANAAWNVGPAGPLGHPKEVRRAYADIAKRNIFLGYVQPEDWTEPDPGPDTRKYYHLVQISQTRERGKDRPFKAWLFNRLDFKWMELRDTPMSGYERFKIKSDYGEVVLDALVLRIDERDVYFQNQSNGRIYALPSGSSIAEAMQRSLSERELVDLGLKKKEQASK